MLVCGCVLINKLRGTAYDSESSKKCYLKNREFRIKQVKEYQKKNQDKVRHWKRKNKIMRKNILKSNINDYTSEQWENCIKYFDNKCAYCGTGTGILTQDHFIPLSKKGDHTKTNIIPCCFSCNSSKNATDFDIWYKDNTKFSKNRYKKIKEYLSQR